MGYLSLRALVLQSALEISGVFFGFADVYSSYIPTSMLVTWMFATHSWHAGCRAHHVDYNTVENTIMHKSHDAELLAVMDKTVNTLENPIMHNA